MKHCAPSPKLVRKNLGWVGGKNEKGGKSLRFEFVGPLTSAPLIKVISTYEHEKVRRVLVPEWTARSKYRYIIG
jgi:hypothetical protein